MDIAFTINTLGLEGLGATLKSLIKHCSDSSALHIWFFCSDCKGRDKASIRNLLAREKYRGAVSFIDFEAKSTFGHLRPLHGDWASYGRLLIPDYITTDKVLYLDSDLIVLVDVLRLKSFDFAGHILAAATGGKTKFALERNFLIQTLKLSPESDYFNAGVLLLNLEQWRLDDVQSKWKAIADQYPQELLAVDQTILNAVCKGQFAHLPAIYNNAWCPGDRSPAEAHQSILHFVGSPKPWDLFGKVLHQGFPLWHSYSPRQWNKIYNTLTWKKVVRTWKIKNSILVKMKQKYVQRA